MDFLVRFVCILKMIILILGKETKCNYWSDWPFSIGNRRLEHTAVKLLEALDRLRLVRLVVPMGSRQHQSQDHQNHLHSVEVDRIAEMVAAGQIHRCLVGLNQIDQIYYNCPFHDVRFAYLTLTAWSTWWITSTTATAAAETIVTSMAATESALWSTTKSLTRRWTSRTVTVRTTLA